MLGVTFALRTYHLMDGLEIAAMMWTHCSALDQFIAWRRSDAAPDGHVASHNRARWRSASTSQKHLPVSASTSYLDRVRFDPCHMQGNLVVDGRQISLTVGLLLTDRVRWFFQRNGRLTLEKVIAKMWDQLLGAENPRGIIGSQ